MKYSSILNALKKFIASLLVAYFSVFSPAIAIAQTDNSNEPVSIPISIPVPVPTPTPSPTPTSTPTPTPTPAPVLKPDLTVALKATAENIGIGVTGSANNKVTILATVKNIGSAPAKPTITKINNSNNVNESWRLGTNSLAPGASQDLTVTTFKSPGTHYFIAETDFDQQVNESNEGNNVSKASVTIPTPKPDLVVLSASPSSQLTVGSKGKFDITIKNIGNADATIKNDEFYVLFTLKREGSPYEVMLTSSFANLQTLKQGETKTFTTSTYYPFTQEGKYTFTGEVDPMKQIDESNENNNKVSSNFEVTQPKADLVVLSATAVGDLKVGSYNNVDIVVKNQGKTNATSFWISANTVDVKTLTQLGLCYAYVDKLAAGATATAQIRNCKQYKYEGSHMIYGKADEFNMVTEEIETNNTYVTYPSVTNPVLLPDLTVGLINVIGNHKVGQTDQVEVSVKNIGNKEVKLVSVGITMYDSKGNKVVNLGTSTRGYTIVPGGSDIARITLPQPYQYIGTHWFKIDLDYANSITESNENNNSQWTSVNVTANLTPSISWSWPDILRSNYYLLLQGTNFGSKQGEIIFIESKTGKEIGKAQPFYWSENYIYSYTPSSLKVGQQYGFYVKTADGKTTPVIWKTAGR